MFYDIVLQNILSLQGINRNNTHIYYAKLTNPMLENISEPEPDRVRLPPAVVPHLHVPHGPQGQERVHRLQGFLGSSQPGTNITKLFWSEFTKTGNAN
jgi:hypothetical protein